MPELKLAQAAGPDAGQAGDHRHCPTCIRCFGEYAALYAEAYGREEPVAELDPGDAGEHSSKATARFARARTRS